MSLRRYMMSLVSLSLPSECRWKYLLSVGGPLSWRTLVQLYNISSIVYNDWLCKIRVNFVQIKSHFCGHQISILDELQLLSLQTVNTARIDISVTSFYQDLRSALISNQSLLRIYKCIFTWQNVQFFRLTPIKYSARLHKLHLSNYDQASSNFSTI